MSDAFLDALVRIVGERHVLTGEADLAPHVADWRGAYRGRTRAVVRPDNTEAVAAVVRACAASGVPLVPQGGNTGMCGGGVPDASGNAIVLALGRMDRIRAVDALNQTITVEAGCILQNVQQAANDADRLFPLSLGAEGSCQIGGNLATNAGGINVLRYGNARDLVLGLEVVLPDGRIWDGLRSLRKDNRGFDLKQLFIGAEGTLGIITAAVLKLFPRPRHEITALLAVPNAEAAISLFSAARAQIGDALQAFELIARPCLDLVFEHVRELRDPFSAPHRWYVLMELGTADDGVAARDRLEALLADAISTEQVSDAVVAQTLEQAASLWRLRESIPEATRAAGPAFRSDISVAVDRIPGFVAAASAALNASPGAPQVVCFGHVGDGNLHFNALAPRGVVFDAWNKQIGGAVYDIVQRFEGSFSAEHGIGQAKREELLLYKSPVEIEMMRLVKRAFDPANLMNPGKVLAIP